ncbi:MAG TPA: PEPxxWA-CTERM sorting domain-containing protein [Phenylobacterium sp.]|jgi:hypothetical protein|nr:PEPxxWA-CTERM sorting domain-containing protein [Phenylobacterium sp.]
MINRGILLAAAGALALASAGSAQALTFFWSFADDVSGHIVDGTISGLEEGVNALSAVTIDVLQADDPLALGGGWAPDTVYGYNNPSTGFTVTDGQITFAHGVFDKSVDQGLDFLFFGSNPGITTYYPQLAGHSVNETDMGVPEHFQAIPEPSTWALLIAGFGLAGASLRMARRRSAVVAA